MQPISGDGEDVQLPPVRPQDADGAEEGGPAAVPRREHPAVHPLPTLLGHLW